MKKQLIIFSILVLLFINCRAQSNPYTGISIWGQKINYETGTLLLSSINATLTTLNLAGVTPKWQSQYMQGVAIATGACQLGYGIWQTRSDFTSLNLVNISAGTATIITNSIMLYKTLKGGGTSKPKSGGKTNTTQFNIYNSPMPFLANKQEVGIRFIKSF